MVKRRKGGGGLNFSLTNFVHARCSHMCNREYNEMRLCTRRMGRKKNLRGRIMRQEVFQKNPPLPHLSPPQYIFHSQLDASSKIKDTQKNLTRDSSCGNIPTIHDIHELLRSFSYAKWKYLNYCIYDFSPTQQLK